MSFRSSSVLTFLAAASLASARIPPRTPAPPIAETTVELEALEVFGRHEEHLALDATALGASRLGLPVLATPASVTVLDGGLLAARGDASLVEAVTRAPGFINLGAPGNGGTSLAARGFVGHGNVMQLLDGTRLYVASGTVTFPFDPDLVDRVEILHGPASVLYGDAATGGAINYVAKAPVDTPLARVGVSAGSWNTFRGTIDTGGPLGEAFAFRAAVTRRESDTERARNATSSLGATGSLRWRPTAAWTSTLSFDYGDREPARYFGTPLIDGRIDPRVERENFNVADSRIRYRDRWTRLVSEWTPTPGVTVRHGVHHLTSDRDWRNVESYTFLPASGLVSRTSPIAINHDLDQTGTRLDATWTVAREGLTHTVLVGGDLNRIRFRHTNNAPFAGGDTVDPFSPAPGLFASTSAYGPGFATDTDQSSLFAEYRLGLGEAWSVVAGARHDRVDLDRRDARSAANSFLRDYAYANGRLGLVWRPVATRAVYAQWGTAADPVGGSLITTAATQRAFDLTESTQWEIGYKQQLVGARGEFTAAVFQLTKNNLLSRDPLDPAVTQQIGEQSSRGVELAGSWRPAAGWRLGANAAWVDARFERFLEVVGGQPVDRRGRRPFNVPAFTANAEVAWTFASRWELAGDLRHVARRFTNVANTDAAPAYTVVDLRLHWRASDSLVVTARLFNALDRGYATTTGNAGRQWLLGTPRRFELGLDHTF